MKGSRESKLSAIYIYLCVYTSLYIYTNICESKLLDISLKDLLVEVYNFCGEVEGNRLAREEAFAGLAIVI